MIAAKRIDDIKAPSFSALFEAKQAYTANTGQEVIDFSIGSSNIPPMDCVKSVLSQAALEDESYQYALDVLPELRRSIQDWYDRRYHTKLDNDEIWVVKGSQEALSHVPMAYCNPQDLVLIPDPYYPIYGTAPSLVHANTYFMPLKAENDYLIDLDAIPEEVARKARLMYVSYPNNPTGAKAPDWFYEKLIAFAKKYDILILHDNAYSELVFEGEPGKSFLEFDGARDVGIELNSFSKSYSMGGARLAVMVGNREMIDVYKKMVNMTDFGAFFAVQKAGAAALDHGDDFVKEIRREYRRRRDFLIDAFEKAGWSIASPQATMFVWARIPEWYDSSRAFLDDLLQKAGVLVNAGSSFGSQGEGFVRLALVRSDAQVLEAARRIAACGIMEKPVSITKQD